MFMKTPTKNPFYTVTSINLAGPHYFFLEILFHCTLTTLNTFTTTSTYLLHKKFCLGFLFHHDVLG